MEVAQNFCRVAGCRHRNTHTTHHHRCGNCGEFGHGQMECRNNRLVENLHMAPREELPRNMWCNMMGCQSRRYHTTAAHHCPNCGENHSILNCNIQTLEENFNRYGRSNDIEPYRQYINVILARSHTNGNTDGVYIETYAGMGCILYIKAKMNSPIQSFFFHADNWGQYGENTSHVPSRDRFLDGALPLPDLLNSDRSIIENQINSERDNQASQTIINNNNSNNSNNISPNVNHRIISCPLCRTDVDTSRVQRIVGSRDTCSVCLEEEVQVFFTECGHAPVCRSCFDHL